MHIDNQVLELVQIVMGGTLIPLFRLLLKLSGRIARIEGKLDVMLGKNTDTRL